jgi:hypothetical protein
MGINLEENLAILSARVRGERSVSVSVGGGA